MNQVIFSFLIILSFSIGGFLGFLAGNGSLVVKLDLATLIGAVGAVGTVFTAVVAYKALHSWREQRIPDAKSMIVKNLITYDNIIFELMMKFNHTTGNIRYSEFVTTYNFLINQLSIIESSIINYYFLELKYKEQVDPLFLDIKKSLSSFSSAIKTHLNTNIKNHHLYQDSDIVNEVILPFQQIHKLKFESVLQGSLNASFALLKEIAGDEIVIRAKENQDNETKINGSS